LHNGKTLDIVAENPDKFQVVALAAGSNVTLLADQVQWSSKQILSFLPFLLSNLKEKILSSFEQLVRQNYALVWVFCMLFTVLQVKTFKPKLVAVRNESLVDELKEALADCEEKPEIIPGEQGIIEVRHF